MVESVWIMVSYSSEGVTGRTAMRKADVVRAKMARVKIVRVKVMSKDYSDVSGQEWARQR
jgi:hypothetical protein